MGLILDSSVVIAAERRGCTVLEILEQIKASHGEIDIGLSVVTVAELIHGAVTFNVRHFQLIPSLKVISN